MTAVFLTLYAIIDFYFFIIIGSVIFSWLYAFNIINTSNQFVAIIGEFFYKLTEPLLRPIRRILPDFGTLDLSPLVLFFAIYFIEVFLKTSIQPIFI